MFALNVHKGVSLVSIAENIRQCKFIFDLGVGQTKCDNIASAAVPVSMSVWQQVNGGSSQKWLTA